MSSQKTGYSFIPESICQQKQDPILSGKTPVLLDSVKMEKEKRISSIFFMHNKSTH